VFFVHLCNVRFRNCPDTFFAFRRKAFGGQGLAGVSFSDKKRPFPGIRPEADAFQASVSANSSVSGHCALRINYMEGIGKIGVTGEIRGFVGASFFAFFAPLRWRRVVRRYL